MIQRRPVTRVTGRSSERLDDDVAVERALEIRVDGRALSGDAAHAGPRRGPRARLPSRARGVLRRMADVRACTAAGADHRDAPDTIDVTLADGVALDWSKLERNFASTAACGICGRAHLESLHAGLAPAGRGPVARFDRAALLALPERVRAPARLRRDRRRACRGVVRRHARAAGAAREDVGRHKRRGQGLWLAVARGLQGSREGLLWVSGRAGAELVLKAARSRIPVPVAVGAPTTLAIELAETAGMTLVGFLREGRMNVYTGDGVA